MGCQHANADKQTGNAQDGRSLTFPEVPSPLDDKLPTAEPCKLYPGCETPAVLTVEWIYTHSSRAKGDDLWKINTGGQFSNWSVRCHWVDVIFFFFLFWSFFVSDHSRVSATGGVRSRRPKRWDEIGSVLCVLSYWPLYPKLLYCLLPSVYSSFFWLLFFAVVGEVGFTGE